MQAKIYRSLNFQSHSTVILTFLFMLSCGDPGISPPEHPALNTVLIGKGDSAHSCEGNKRDNCGSSTIVSAKSCEELNEEECKTNSGCIFTSSKCESDPFSETSCQGTPISTQEAMNLLGASTSVGLSDTYLGQVHVYARKRSCVDEVCNAWSTYDIKGYGAHVKPVLAISGNSLVLSLDRDCQGSSGHGTTCKDVGSNNIQCKPIIATPQCAGWTGDGLAGVTFRGLMTNHCLRLFDDNRSTSSPHTLEYVVLIKSFFNNPTP